VLNSGQAEGKTAIKKSKLPSLEDSGFGGLLSTVFHIPNKKGSTLSKILLRRSQEGHKGISHHSAGSVDQNKGKGKPGFFDFEKGRHRGKRFGREVTDRPSRKENKDCLRQSDVLGRGTHGILHVGKGRGLSTRLVLFSEEGGKRFNSARGAPSFADFHYANIGALANKKRKERGRAPSALYELERKERIQRIRKEESRGNRIKAWEPVNATTPDVTRGKIWLFATDGSGKGGKVRSGVKPTRAGKGGCEI